MSGTADAVDGFQNLIMENTYLKKQVKDYEDTNGKLQALSDSIGHLEEQKKAKQDEIDAMEKAHESKIASIESRAGEVKAVSSDEMEALEKERADIQAERESIKAERAALKADRDESDKLKAQIEEQKEEMKARELEILENKSGRSAQIAAIKEERAAQATEKLHLEAMREESIKAVDENRAVLEEINKAKAGSEQLMADINEARQKAEDRRVAAQNEISSASYIQDTARNMMTCFRQALNTYIQLNGQAIQIPEITDEHRLFIVKDMLSQITTPWDLESIGITGELAGDEVKEETPDVKVEMEELAVLRKQYKEKFQKNYFPGWGVEELKSKLK